MAYEIYPGTLYHYTAGLYCGVLMKESVMKKLAKLQQKHMEDVKRLLADNKDDLFPYSWTLYYPNGEQTTVTHFDNRDVEEAIKSALMGSEKPEPKYPVYNTTSMEEAKRMAEERFKATGSA